MKLYQKYKSDYDNYFTSYLKLLGKKKLVDIIGWIVVEDDEPVFHISRLVFDDGSDAYVEGGHDEVTVSDCTEEVSKLLLKVYRSDPDNEEEFEE